VGGQQMRRMELFLTAADIKVEQAMTPHGARRT
jgi:hypothetical protein